LTYQVRGVRVLDDRDQRRHLLREQLFAAHACSEGGERLGADVRDVDVHRRGEQPASRVGERERSTGTDEEEARRAARADLTPLGRGEDVPQQGGTAAVVEL